MMQTLRKKMKYVLGVALAGFLLLIFFQWGANITGIRKEQKTDIAVIDGVRVSYTDYYAFSQTREQEDKNISSDEVWQLLIDEIMWNKLMAKEKISVTDDEIWVVIRNNPPRDVIEADFMKDENGQFDYNKYLELLAAPQSRSWLYAYERNLRKQLPREKYRSLLSTFGWVSPYEDSLALVAQSTTYDITYVHVPLFRMRSQITLSDDELREYYLENKEKFVTEEMKILDYVFFERKPSSFDTLEAREQLEDFVARVRDGEDFLTLAQEMSDDTSVVVDFEGPAGLKPYLMNVYKELKDGEMSEIVQAARGFEVIKRVKKGKIYKMKIEIIVSETTKGEIYDRVMSFKETSEALGFDSAAAELELPVRKTYPMSSDNVAFPVRNPEGLGKFLKDARYGDIGGPYGSLGGYYLFTIDSIIPQTHPSFEDVASRVRAEAEREMYGQALDEKLTQAYDQLTAGASIEDIVSQDTLLLKQERTGATLAEIIGFHGGEFAGVLAKLDPGQVSSPFITDWAGYIVRCDQKNASPFDSTMYLSLQMKRQNRLQEITSRAFTPKKIEDFRDDFFE